MNRILRRILWNSIARHHMSETDLCIERIRTLKDNVKFNRLELADAEAEAFYEALYAEFLKRLLDFQEKRLDFLELEGC